MCWFLLAVFQAPEYFAEIAVLFVVYLVAKLLFQEMRRQAWVGFAGAKRELGKTT